MRWHFPAIILVLGVGLSMATTAEILDDSGSPKNQYSFDFDWVKKDNIQDLSEDEVFAERATVSNVEVHLNTEDFVGQTARIYMQLPTRLEGLNGSTGFSMSWDTRGLLSSGSVTPGNRALIFDGVISDPVMIEFFDYTFDLDVRQTSGAQPLAFGAEFEIELQ